MVCDSFENISICLVLACLHAAALDIILHDIIFCSQCTVLFETVVMFRACRQFASTAAGKHARVRYSAKSQHLLDRTLRVDHAGEFGAVQIYRGQLAVLGRSDVAPTLQVQYVAADVLNITPQPSNLKMESHTNLKVSEQVG